MLIKFAGFPVLFVGLKFFVLMGFPQVSSGVVCGVDGLALMGYSCYSCNCAGHRRADCCFENDRYSFLISAPENDS